MEANIIERALVTKSVLEAQKSLRISNNKLLTVFHDTGCEYIDNLKVRVRRKKSFDRLFQPVVSTIPFCTLKPSQVFELILYSNHFWDWWSTQLWKISHDSNFADLSEFLYRLQYNTELIPPTVIRNIFSNDKRKEENSNGFQQRAEGTDDNNATKTENVAARNKQKVL